MKKKKQYTKPIKKKPVRFETIIFVFFMSAMLYIFIMALVERHKLKQNGVITQAVIVDIGYAKGKIYLFKYVVNGQIYVSWHGYVPKCEYDELQIGQVYLLRYVSDEPTLSELVEDKFDNVIQVFETPSDTSQLDTLKKYGLFPIESE